VQVMNRKLCPECSFEIIGRKDKRFCSDQCRNTFNNRLNKDANKHIRRINLILRKNRRILNAIMNEGHPEIQRKALLDKGFDFNYYTHIRINNSGMACHYCYDIGYCEREDGRIIFDFQITE
jgi:predicted nucleic acid-binding Zn ribbon protein